MPKLFFPKCDDPLEKRTALTPATCGNFLDLGFEVSAERGLGEAAGFLDADYVGIQWGNMDNAAIVIEVIPQDRVLSQLAAGTTHISLLDAYRYGDIIEKYKSQLKLISLERIPRSTFAQKMDVLSSQASLSGYAAVIQAVAQVPSVFPMMTTPAGTITPQRVLVIGAGVAGLQAIATARRLGANVEAFDTRPEVEEQVRSLGAKFVKIDLGETGTSQQGYANALTEGQLQLQREGLKMACQRANIVITTAKLFGCAAPRIITEEMIFAMKPGALIIDLAVAYGGNVENSKPETITISRNGVRILGMAYPESTIAKTASDMFSANIYQLIAHLTNNSEHLMTEEDPIYQSCLVR